MPEFAANLGWLFREHPSLDRIAAAKQAGFAAVEIPFPYEDAATEVIRRLTATGLPLVLINTPPPNYTGGDRGFAALPDGQDRFRRDFTRTLRYAQRLRPRHIHVMAGKAAGPEALQVFVENLTWATRQAPDQSLTIAPMAPATLPGWFLNDFDQAADILARVGAENLGLQFNSHHAQAITGDAVACFTRHAGLIRHVQIAGHPGQGEPTGDDIDLAALFRALDAADYTGFVGAEYAPTGRTEDGLDWMRRGWGTETGA